MTHPPDIATRGAAGGRIRLVVTDVDGTLLDNNHRVPAENVAAIAHAQQAGLKVMLATSRGPGALTSVLAALPALADAVFICSQGALTARVGDDGTLDVVTEWNMRVDAAHRTVAVARERGIAVGWYYREHWYVSDLDHTITDEAAITETAPTVCDLDELTEGPDKLMLIAPDGRPETLDPVIAAMPEGLRAQISNPTYLEITRADVDKAHALAEYCRAAGIDPGEVLAVGDGPNDLGMLRFAGVGVAPANARPAVLDAADYSTSANCDAGVGHVLRSILEVLAC
ncbi:Cof-type HAD-IIB family hydrolase [Mycobacterium sp. 155]|uniref:Cof-type HAD-IIB family hydrolase n=1 Tax=Mycobacterium sp. 155 TaxID=1157943 RepID=UPI00037C93DF|nr:Cof-type HAD-IIB family hydrolase [Mycobacterium sp. 155]